jgi:hypothetical protein
MGWLFAISGIITAVAGTRQKPLFMEAAEFLHSSLSFWFRLGMSVAFVGFVLMSVGYALHQEKKI